MTNRFEHNGKRIPQAPVNLDPSDQLDYGTNWVDELETGEVITASTWTISPTTATILSDGFTSTVATALISGGVAGTNYTLTNTITTANRKESRSMYIKCEQK